MEERVRVLPVEDGGNPRQTYDIVRRDDDWYIFPFSEDGDPNYKFHMNVRVENDSGETVPVTFTVNWGDEVYQNDRMHLLICTSEDDWQYVSVTANGPEIVGTAQVPPGVSYLTFHPRYEHGRLDRLVHTLSQDVFEIKTVGRSRKNREILAIEAGQGGGRPVAFYGRVHPYETVSSYLIEGMIKWLAKDSEQARALLSERRIAFIPMPNPDGVAEGTNKLTLGGLNFSTNFRSSHEPEAAALKRYFAELKPSIIFDLHGWNNRKDNIVTNSGPHGRAVYNTLLDDPLFYKPIDIMYRYPAWGARDHSCTYFAGELGLTYFNSSWNHVGRTSADLYAMGAAILKAVAAAER